jgi:amino acid transporter
MTMRGRSSDGDARELARFGYAQELVRRLGAFSTFAIAFSIISVLTGVTSTFGDALASGGPVGLGLGWPLVACGTMVVALAMAELASAFPTAGALYHWSALLGGPFWGWATAMLNLVGQLAIVAAIDLACAQALAQILGWGAFGSYGLYAAIVAVHGVLNATSVPLVAWLNDASATVHVAGVLLLAGWLSWKGIAHPASYLLQGPPAGASGGAALGFIRSLVLGVWTFTGFDAAAHVSEETHDPGRRAPYGIVSSVAVSAVAGFALVVALTLSVRDAAAIGEPADAALNVLRGALGPQAGSIAMGLVVLAMWFAGLSSVTSASRMLFAFARDGGLPMAALFRRIDPRTHTPVNATVACVLAPLALVAATAGLSDAVFLAVAALATVALYVSYALPIALGVRARAQGRWKRLGVWHLGRAGRTLAWIAVAWTAGVVVVCALANALSVAAFGAVIVALLAVWRLRVRGSFTGPSVDLAQFEEGSR